jgi:hypothetical protein
VEKVENRHLECVYSSLLTDTTMYRTTTQYKHVLEGEAGLEDFS